MERKIGEIFEYNGEWYQCVEGTGCYKCDFNIDENTCIADNPHCTCRSDKKDVIFKKLEKVGEPYKFGRKLMQKYNIYAKPYLSDDYGYIYIPGRYNEVISIEIKQNKEDMEEYKTPLPKEDNHLTRIVYAYVNGKISDKELIRSIKEMSDEYPYDKNNLKPFSLEAAKAGKPVCTRDGRKARIICFDRVGDFPIVALTDDRDYKEEGVNLYDINGKGSNECFDLMMLPKKKEGWVNIYYEHDAPSHREASWVYDKEEEAIKVGKEHGSCYIATVRIEWEE